MTLPSASHLLVASFVLLQAIDFCFTHQLLEGARPDVYEANPLATRILHLHGWGGLALFKLGCTLLGLAAVGLLWRQRAQAARRVLLGMCLVMTGVVVYSGALLAAPADPAHAELPRLQEESNQIDQFIEALKVFDKAKGELCDDLLAGRCDLDDATTAMRQLLEQHGPHLLPCHRANLPDVQREEHVVGYLYLRLSTHVVSRPDAKDQLRRLRQTILNRYPDIILVDFNNQYSYRPLPWLAHLQG